MNIAMKCRKICEQSRWAYGETPCTAKEVPAEAGFSPHLDRGSGKMQADGLAAGGVRQEGGRTANGGKEGEKMSEG